MKELSRESLWSSTAFAPVRSLDALRNAVLQRSIKRMPKWKFRITEDMVMQLQPKLTYLKVVGDKSEYQDRGFYGTSLISDAASAATFSPEQRHAASHLSMDYVIHIVDDIVSPINWLMHPYRYGWRSSHSDHDAEVRLIRDRTIDALTSKLVMLNTSMMLQPSCLMCGKRLTDPVSMARWIGPECYGSASSVIPWMIEAGWMVEHQ